LGVVLDRETTPAFSAKVPLTVWGCAHSFNRLFSLEEQKLVHGKPGLVSSARQLATQSAVAVLYIYMRHGSRVLHLSATATTRDHHGIQTLQLLKVSYIIHIVQTFVHRRPKVGTVVMMLLSLTSITPLTSIAFALVIASRIVKVVVLAIHCVPPQGKLGFDALIFDYAHRNVYIDYGTGGLFPFDRGHRGEAFLAVPLFYCSILTAFSRSTGSFAATASGYDSNWHALFCLLFHKPFPLLGRHRDVC